MVGNLGGALPTGSLDKENYCQSYTGETNTSEFRDEMGLLEITFYFMEFIFFKLS